MLIMFSEKDVLIFPLFLPRPYDRTVGLFDLYFCPSVKVRFCLGALRQKKFGLGIWKLIFLLHQTSNCTAARSNTDHEGCHQQLQQTLCCHESTKLPEDLQLIYLIVMASVWGSTALILAENLL